MRPCDAWTRHDPIVKLIAARADRSAQTVGRYYAGCPVNPATRQRIEAAAQSPAVRRAIAAANTTPPAPSPPLLRLGRIAEQHGFRGSRGWRWVMTEQRRWEQLFSRRMAKSGEARQADLRDFAAYLDARKTTTTTNTNRRPVPMSTPFPMTKTRVFKLVAALSGATEWNIQRYFEGRQLPEEMRALIASTCTQGVVLVAMRKAHLRHPPSPAAKERAAKLKAARDARAKAAREKELAARRAKTAKAAKAAPTPAPTPPPRGAPIKSVEPPPRSLTPKLAKLGTMLRRAIAIVAVLQASARTHAVDWARLRHRLLCRTRYTPKRSRAAGAVTRPPRRHSTSIKTVAAELGLDGREMSQARAAWEKSIGRTIRKGGPTRERDLQVLRAWVLGQRSNANGVATTGQLEPMGQLEMSPANGS